MVKKSINLSSNLVPAGKAPIVRQDLKHYYIRGTVVHGNHLGSTLGYPTANIQPHQDQPAMIPNGVYLVSVLLQERKFFGLCNIGNRPTIGGKQLVIEVNILDFSEDIYGKDISIKVIRAIRKEKKFQNLTQLVDQINFDKEKVMKILSVLLKDQTS